MSAPCIAICKRSDQEWGAARLPTIGSSESPGVLGVSTFCSAYSVWAERVIGQAEPYDDEKLTAGRLLQPGIAAIASWKLGGPVREVETLFRSTLWPWLSATPDYEIDHPELGTMDLELKNSTETSEWVEDKPVPRNWVQCQHQLAVRGGKYMVLFGLLWGYNPRHYIIQRDDRFIEDRLVPETKRIWDMIQSGERPRPDHSDACRNAILREFPISTPGKIIDLPHELWTVTDEVMEVDGKIAVLNDERERLRNEIRVGMGDADRAVLDRGYWTNTSNKKGQRSLRFWPKNGE